MLSPTYSSCVLYSAALAAHGGPRLNCLKMLGGLDPGYACAKCGERVAGMQRMGFFRGGRHRARFVVEREAGGAGYEGA